LRELTPSAEWWPLIERGFPQREIADAAYRYQVAVDRKQKIVVGVNEYLVDEKPIENLAIDQTVGGRQADRLRKRAPTAQAPKSSAA